MTSTLKDKGFKVLLRNDETDDRLMQAYAKGYARAFDRLYARYKDRLYGYLVRNCRDAQKAEELYQDIWLRVISSAKKYKANGRFRSWLFTLAHHRLVDFYKSNENRVQMEVFEEQRTSETSPEEEIISHQRKQSIDFLVNSLPPDQKMAFYLREESGFSLKEIAGIQGISHEAAKSRLRYAYQKIRSGLKGEGAVVRDRPAIDSGDL